MDIFIEQLYAVPQTGATAVKKILIWGVAVILILILLFLGFFVLNFLFSIAFLVAFGVGFLAHFLSGKLNVEYEYILTDGEIAIDRIQNQRRRKRMLKFNCGEISGLGPENRVPPGRQIERFCAKDDGYFFAAGEKTVIFAPNERFREEMAKFVPRYLKKELEELA